MFDLMLAHYLRSCQLLSEKVADVTREQWKFVTEQSQFGLSLWKLLLGEFRKVATSSRPPGATSEPEKMTHSESLEQETAKRFKEGFAPPREIYDVRNRGRIDWSTAPDWAKPADPELFEGAHEG